MEIISIVTFNKVTEVKGERTTVQQISHLRILKMTPHYFCLIKHFCSRKPHILALLSLLTHLGIKNLILS